MHVLEGGIEKKKRALARLLKRLGRKGLEPDALELLIDEPSTDRIFESSFRKNDLVFYKGGKDHYEEYFVFTPEEAFEFASAEAKELLNTFKPEFLIKYTKFSPELKELLKGKSSPQIFQVVKDRFKELCEDLIAEKRLAFFCARKGEKQQEQDGFLIFRIN